VLKPPFKLLVKNWWPVTAWLVVIRLESTNYASSGNTFNLLYRISTMIFGRVDPRLLYAINEVLRKSGHFIGYAILSVLVFLALKHTHRDRLKPVLQRSWGIFFRDTWQFDWALIAVLFTIVAASWDEIHQTFLVSRTGRWQDVAIDTSGAVLAQLLLYARAAHAMNRQRHNSVEEPEPSLTR
jgi:VanZ family protein